MFTREPAETVILATSSAPERPYKTHQVPNCAWETHAPPARDPAASSQGHVDVPVWWLIGPSSLPDAPRQPAFKLEPNDPAGAGTPSRSGHKLERSDCANRHQGSTGPCAVSLMGRSAFSAAFAMRSKCTAAFSILARASLFLNLSATPRHSWARIRSLSLLNSHAMIVSVALQTTGGGGSLLVTILQSALLALEDWCRGQRKEQQPQNRRSHGASCFSWCMSSCALTPQGLGGHCH